MLLGRGVDDLAGPGRGRGWDRGVRRRGGRGRSSLSGRRLLRRRRHGLPGLGIRGRSLRRRRGRRGLCGESLGLGRRRARCLVPHPRGRLLAATRGSGIRERIGGPISGAERLVFELRNLCVAGAVEPFQLEVLANCVVEFTHCGYPGETGYAPKGKRYRLRASHNRAHMHAPTRLRAQAPGRRPIAPSGCGPCPPAWPHRGPNPRRRRGRRSPRPAPRARRRRC